MTIQDLIEVFLKRWWLILLGIVFGGIIAFGITEYLIEPSLMIEEPITDAIITKINNEYYMFATTLPNPNGNYMPGKNIF